MIKIGIVGFGWISENIHMPSFSKINEVEIVSIYDRDIERVKENLSTKHKSKINLYKEYDEFLKSGIDAVIIATPNYTHSNLAIRALNSDIHVLCEKPLTISKFEFQNIIEAEKNSKAKFIPAYVNRYREDISKFDELLECSEIGEIKKIEISWIRNKGIPRPGTWFTNKELSGGGVLTDLGPHMIDLGLKYIPNKVVKKCELKSWYDMEKYLEYNSKWFEAQRDKFQEIDVERAVCGCIEFEKIKMEVKLSWASQYNGDFTCLKVTGDRGSCELRTLFGLSEQPYFKEGEVLVKGEKKVTFSLDKGMALKAFDKMAENFIDTARMEKENDQELLECRHVIELMDTLYDNEKRVEESFESIVGQNI